MNDLVIVGGGGHGRELHATLLAVNEVRPTWRILGVVDDALEHPERLEALGVAVLGDLSWLDANPVSYALGVGDPGVRRRLDERFGAVGAAAATVVHPGATVGTEVFLAPGTVIFDRCTITTNVRIGRHTHLNVGCAVQHDSVVGDYVQLSPGVLVNGDCTVGDGAFFGSGAILTRGCQVGSGARVGAGAVVLRDVPPNSTAVGVPALDRTIPASSEP